MEKINIYFCGSILNDSSSLEDLFTFYYIDIIRRIYKYLKKDLYFTIQTNKYKKESFEFYLNKLNLLQPDYIEVAEKFVNNKNDNNDLIFYENNNENNILVKNILEKYDSNDLRLFCLFSNNLELKSFNEEHMNDIINKNNILNKFINSNSNYIEGDSEIFDLIMSEKQFIKYMEELKIEELIKNLFYYVKIYKIGDESQAFVQKYFNILGFEKK